MNYADAINAAIQERHTQLQDYGGLLAQAGMSLTDTVIMDSDEHKHVAAGYHRQLAAFPEG